MEKIIEIRAAEGGQDSKLFVTESQLVHLLCGRSKHGSNQ